MREHSTPFDKLVEQGWTLIAPDGSVWGTGWVCDKCGQPLGETDECNSGIHVGPDGTNKGRAVHAVTHEAEGERVSVTTYDWERRALSHHHHFSIEHLRATAISLLVYCEAHDA